jgi:hypothetical protein
MNKVNGLLTPPEGWAVVEPGLFRSSYLTAGHLPFLTLTGVKTVVNMSTKSLGAAAALEAVDLRVFQPCVLASQATSDDRSQFGDEIVKDALEFILEKSHHPLVLTGVRPSNGLEVAALVGCLRRVQNWALTPIFFEFRLFVPNAPIYDVNR